MLMERHRTVWKDNLLIVLLYLGSKTENTARTQCTIQRISGRLSIKSDTVFMAVKIETN